ncbi:polysaccharide biosynthesis C-terminal domain-containing protein, partial [bacterium]|nr:polysaccharide biosynthesis C-terminal domain-containing protein [bacterium]
IIRIFKFQPEFFQGWGIYAILVSGILLCAGYLPFQMMLNQIGLPAYQTTFMILFVGTNFVLNLILIPILGMLGAAIATAVAYASQIIYLRMLTFRAVGIRI